MPVDIWMESVIQENSPTSATALSPPLSEIDSTGMVVPRIWSCIPFLPSRPWRDLWAQTHLPTYVSTPAPLERAYSRKPALSAPAGRWHGAGSHRGATAEPGNHSPMSTPRVAAPESSKLCIWPVRRMRPGQDLYLDEHDHRLRGPAALAAL